MFPKEGQQVVASVSEGNPVGMSPTTAMPCPSKLKTAESTTESTRTATGPGTGKRTIRKICNNPNIPKANTRDGQWIDPAFCRSSMTGLSKPSDSMSTPVTRLICPTKIDSEMPVKNPIRIGRDRKFARTPSRSTHAAR